ncbi:MAG: carboxypeptidase regulatory-like domain-containing protein, partial [Bacteroidia bacterium]|nr:carboxypeptidase regulatory-like domain-containing protein [Bacteroidia bacterium]
MKHTFILLFFALFLFSISQAQKSDGTIKGKLIDTSANQPISDATISVINTKDSSLAFFTLSDKQGFFEVKGLDSGSYKLVISYEGYVETKQLFSINTINKTISLGDLSIEKDYKTLGEVVVNSEAPIQVKNDTVQFNASGFKTKPNATVEDLLKKLPGVEV